MQYNVSYRRDSPCRKKNTYQNAGNRNQLVAVLHVAHRREGKYRHEEEHQSSQIEGSRTDECKTYSAHDSESKCKTVVSQIPVNGL